MLSRFASKLINYIEPSEYNGVLKTALYTQFGTNFQIGDKVFIVNGNYDSNSIIVNNEFTKGDGYTVLDIDRCRIILDIDFTGQYPYNTDDVDNFIKLHNVSSQREFDYVNTLTTNTYATYSSKFEYGLTNDLVYVGGSFSGTTSVIGNNTGVSQSGFYQKQTSNNSWINITSAFSSGDIFFKTTGPGITYSLTNNNLLLIVGENISVGPTVYTQRGVYTYSSSQWTLDNTYNKSFISKLSFRNGLFKGTWNDGIYGSYDDSINWNRSEAVWNSGIFLNSTWELGTINSRNSKPTSQTVYTNQLYSPSFPTTISASYSILTYQTITASRTIDYNSSVKQTDNSIIQSYYCKLDIFGNPIQSTDFSNNNGFGFNYIIDSIIETGNIINGNFENCNIGLTNYGVNSIDVYYGMSYSYNIQTLGGNYTLCDVNTAAFNNSNINNSNINNSNINNSVLSSNQIVNTVASGEYSADNGINILNADVWSYVTKDNRKRGVLKLFIDSSDINRITDFETIYINRINKELYLSSFTDDNKVWLNYENKYIIDYFNNNEITSVNIGGTSGTIQSSIVVSVKYPNDNIYKSYVKLTGATYTNAYTLNTNQYASIDIDLGETIAWYTDGTSSYYLNTNPVITTDNVSNLFSNTQIDNSDFNSGILVNSTWRSGDNYNDISNNIIISGGSYSIQVRPGSTNSISIDLSNSVYNKYNSINIGDYIWINGLDYATSSVDFSARFKVTGTATGLSSSRRFILTEQTNVIYNNSLTSSGHFLINNLSPTYVSVNKFKIDNSTIINGTFKTSLIVNSTIINSSFNNLDKTLTISNINSLRFINILFKNDNNNINNGIVYKSHIVNTTWNNGIAFNSLVNGNTFSNGLFKNGYWLNGSFNNGVFSDSVATIASTSSYENTSNYRSWRNGSFNNGQFYNSIWIDGVFNNGRFYSSTWYAGTWNNGILGILNSQYYNTTMGYYPNIGVGSTFTTWNYGIVESAIIGGSSSVYWMDGKFNNGEFTSNGHGYESIWYNGDFNGGKFDGYAKWKNGDFNKGKFLSYYGWTLSSSTSSADYSWENGTFNGGQFGQASLGTNSTWYNGEFNDGYFYGRVWNYGIFTKGNFFGSATYSVTASQKTEYNFVNSFTSSYYGLWRDGYFVDSIHLGNPDQKIYTDIKRATDNKKVSSTATIQNSLWLNGTFSHASGTTNNIVWLNGSFIKGNFNNSAFNPFVDRTLSGFTNSSELTFNFNDTCTWYNGSFNGGNFYISEWVDGVFNSGYMLGAIWNKGTWFYGSAENIYWKSGTWKNGNWYGTNFNYMTVATSSLIVIDPMTIDIINNIASVSGDNTIHLLNAFTGSYTEILFDPSFTNEMSPENNYHGWTQSGANAWVWADSYPTYSDAPPFSITLPNYQYGLTATSNILYGLAYVASAYTTSIFTDNIDYTVNIFGVAGRGHGTYYPIQITIYVGNTYSNFLITPSGGFNYTLTYTAAEITYWTNGFTNTKLGIKLGAHNNPTNLVVLTNVQVLGNTINYSSLYNNTLYDGVNSGTVSLPSISLLSSNGVSVQYGNGSFVSGVWENGVWNNGYRDDLTLTRCVLYPIASYIKISKIKHRIQLNIIQDDSTNFINRFNAGDLVSVGNIVSIDINQNRKLIKDMFTIISMNTSNITSVVLEISLNYPILQIVQDSQYHLIYLSKNVWLSGGFLNGYFEGIWNYGLFTGFPYITYMNNSHWIDGIFDGGHFQSITSSYLTDGVNNIYNTGLIQNFNFTDNNIALPYNFLYQSWIDVNYATNSMSNTSNQVIYTTQSTALDTGFFDTTVVTSPYKASIPDLNGYITYDVLSSKSNFRQGNSSKIEQLSLGVKYKKFNNFIPNDGLFTNAFSSVINPPGTTLFISDGWTFSINYPFYDGGYMTYESGITSYALNLISYSASFYDLSFYKLDNNNISILPNRYSMIEVNVSSIFPSVVDTYNNTNIFTSYQKADYSLFANNYINYATTASVSQEYFYNKPDLGLYIIQKTNESVYSQVVFDEISLIEIDMIPFFQYTTQANVDSAVYDPYTAIAPIINYENSNFNYIGNINLTFNINYIVANNTVYNASNSGNILPDVSIGFSG